MNAHHARRGKRLYRCPPGFLLYMGMMVLPVLALYRMTDVVDVRVLSGFVGGISVTTFFLYWRDKRSAQSGGWRTPESTLHLAELLGGWPAALVAQRMLRHKSSKPAYRAVFWTIVGFHQFVSLDFLLNWTCARTVIGALWT